MKREFTDLLTDVTVNCKEENGVHNIDIYLSTPGVNKSNIKNAEIIVGEKQESDTLQFEIEFEPDHILFPKFKKKYSYKLNTDLFYKSFIDEDAYFANEKTLNTYVSIGINPHLASYLVKDHAIVTLKRNVTDLSIDVKDGITKITIKLQDPVQNKQTIKATVN